jgi:hypothetical protein
MVEFEGRLILAEVGVLLMCSRHFTIFSVALS